MTSVAALLVAVRLAPKYEASHASSTLNVPLYKPIEGWGPAATIRRAGFAFFGIYGTGALLHMYCQPEFCRGGPGCGSAACPEQPLALIPILRCRTPYASMFPWFRLNLQ